MLLQTLEVRRLEKTSTIVKFGIKVRAVLEAAEETTVGWMPKGKLVSWSYQRRYGHILPFFKELPILVEDPQMPPDNLGMGDGWEPDEWIQEIQRSDIRVVSALTPEFLRFHLSLVPHFNVNASNEKYVQISEDV